MKKQTTNTSFPNNLREALLQHIFNTINEKYIAEPNFLTVIDVLIWLRQNAPLGIEPSLVADGSIYLIKDGIYRGETPLCQWDKAFNFLCVQPNQIFKDLYQWAQKNIDNFKI